MLASAIPIKFNEIWAASASSTYVTYPIPVTTGTAGRASLDQGFPAVTFTPVGSGGDAPDGRDMNGILQQITAWSQWQQIGGPITYDSAIQTAISGYPKGAVVQSATTAGKFWLSTADSNATNPDTGGGGWAVYNNSYTAGSGLALSSGAFSIATGGIVSSMIAAGAVTNTTMAAMAANTVKANITGGSAAPTDVSQSAFVAWLGTPFTGKFTSSQVGLGSTSAVAAHGLGAQPFGWSASLICTDAGGDQNFAQNQQILLPATTNNGVSGGSQPFGTISVFADSSAVYASYDTSSIWVANASTGARGQIVPSKWRLIFRAWL